MLTLAMPQSVPLADRNRSASRRSVVKIADDRPCGDVVVDARSPRRGRRRASRRGSARRSPAARLGTCSPACRRWRARRRRRPVRRPRRRARRRDTSPPAAAACGEGRAASRRRRLVDQRADERAGVAGIADRQRGVGVREPVDQLVVDRSRGRSGGAASCSAGRRCRRRRTRSRAGRQVQVGRGRDDRGVVAAELEQACGRTARRRCGPTVAPIAVDAGGRDQRQRGRRRPAPRRLAAADETVRRARQARRRTCRRRAASRPATASAVSGVFSDGFQTTGSPQTSASAAFQAQTATGKLNAVITPTRPERMPGLHHPVAGALGGDRQAVAAGATGRRRSRRCRSSPAPRPGPRERSCRPPA